MAIEEEGDDDGGPTLSYQACNVFSISSIPVPFLTTLCALLESGAWTELERVVLWMKIMERNMEIHRADY